MRIQARIVRKMLGSDEVPLPKYETVGSAAMDLRACIDEPLTLAPGARATIPTGLAVDMQDPGIAAIVMSRSGLASKHGVVVIQGGGGLIDSDYQGEIGVILNNRSDVPYTIEPGDRIAQLMFQPVIQVSLDWVEAFDQETCRGAGGFGSTGKA